MYEFVLLKFIQFLLFSFFNEFFNFILFQKLIYFLLIKTISFIKVIAKQNQMVIQYKAYYTII